MEKCRFFHRIIAVRYFGHVAIRSSVRYCGHGEVSVCSSDGGRGGPVGIYGGLGIARVADGVKYESAMHRQQQRIVECGPA